MQAGNQFSFFFLKKFHKISQEEVVPNDWNDLYTEISVSPSLHVWLAVLYRDSSYEC